MERGSELWRLEALRARVERALSVGYQPASSGRVRAVPDGRTIRYYTTLGLVDRPAQMKGRTAYYGQRHVLQLVAIKRLQGEGLTLAQVQERLAGLDDEALAAIAQLPDELPEAPPPARPDFWAATPADLEAPVEVRGAEREDSRSRVEPALALAGIELAKDATLLLACDHRALNTDDLRALRVAAQPLLDLLERRGLLPREDR